MKGRQKHTRLPETEILSNTNQFKYQPMLLHSSDVEVDEMGWITVISHSLLYMESHIRGYHSHAPAQANHHSHAVPGAGQEGVQVEIM